MNHKVLGSKFNFKQYERNPTDILETPRNMETVSTLNLRNEINSFSEEGESIYETDVIYINNTHKFKEYKKITAFISEEIEILGKFNNKIFADLRVLV